MWLLARRNLAVRPGRTLLFLAGFALAVGVMIALLSVGEAIVEQARDKDLVGGGDLVLVPAGSDVDVLKLGGVTAMFSTIPNARFLQRQLLAGPRFADDIAAAAPAWAARPVYLRARAGGPVVQGLASATVPSHERAAGGSTLPPDWADSPGEIAFARRSGASLLHEMDGAHRPAPGHPEADRWAEWWYFNLLDPASGRFAYLSFFVAGDPRGGRALGSLSVQVGAPGVPATRHVFVVPIDTTATDPDSARVRLVAKGASAPGATMRLVDGTYRLAARFRDARSGAPVALDLDVVPAPHAYYPPLVLRGADGFESGYVVPAALARARGTIDAGGSRTEFRDALAYHDHNWGYWKSVAWDWGQAQAPDGRFAIVYAAVHAPELDAGGENGRLFAIVTGEDGFLGAVRPRAIEYGNWRPGPAVDGRRVPVPGWVRFAAEGEDDTLAVDLAVADVTASRPAGDPRARDGGAGPALGAGRVFLQMRGTWTVRGRVGGRRVEFQTPGAAETFVPAP